MAAKKAGLLVLSEQHVAHVLDKLSTEEIVSLTAFTQEHVLRISFSIACITKHSCLQLEEHYILCQHMLVRIQKTYLPKLPRMYHKPRRSKTLSASLQLPQTTLFCTCHQD